MNERDEDYEVLRPHLFPESGDTGYSSFTFTPRFPSFSLDKIKSMKDLASVVKNSEAQELLWVKGPKCSLKSLFTYTSFHYNYPYSKHETFAFNHEFFKYLYEKALLITFQDWRDFDKVPEILKHRLTIEQSMEKAKEIIHRAELITSTLEEKQNAQAARIELDCLLAGLDDWT